jgi:hypothetical protein
MVKVKEKYCETKYRPAGILLYVNGTICFIYKLQFTFSNNTMFSRQTSYWEAGFSGKGSEDNRLYKLQTRVAGSGPVNGNPGTDRLSRRTSVQEEEEEMFSVLRRSKNTAHNHKMRQTARNINIHDESP